MINKLEKEKKEQKCYGLQQGGFLVFLKRIYMYLQTNLHNASILHSTNQ